MKLRTEYGSIDDAEDRLGITYMEDAAVVSTPPPLSLAPILTTDLKHLSELQKQELLQRLLPEIRQQSSVLEMMRVYVRDISLDRKSEIIQECFESEELDHVGVLDGLFFKYAKTVSDDIGYIPAANFIQLSISAMKKLKALGKSNLIYKWPRCIALTREESEESLIPLKRMPFGLIEYQIDFFNATHVNQIKESEDYSQWRETLDAELTLRQDKLITGPMWSGCETSDIRKPLKARVNLACRSKRTVSRTQKQVDGVSTEPVIQKGTILELKKANPDGRFWLKADGVDVKSALQESMRGLWNGDSDMGDGKLQNLRKIYDDRRSHIGEVLRYGQYEPLNQIEKDLVEDKQFLSDGLETAIKTFTSKSHNKNTPEEALKAAHWEVVEFTKLVTHCQQFQSYVQKLLGRIASDTITPGAVKDDLRSTDAKYSQYLKNIFKKKRQPPASHVLVFMASDERRHKKPYAAPVQFVPYHSLRDQYIRDFTKQIKLEMTSHGLDVVGTVTDGEFCSLRSMGETRPLHLWQLVHDAKQAVSKMKKDTLRDFLIPTGVIEDGVPLMVKENKVVPLTLKLQLYTLIHEIGESEEEAIADVRQELVPTGYVPHSWKAKCPEKHLDRLRSILATMYFRNSVESWCQKGVNFQHHLYVPEVDPSTNSVHHERADHCHLLKRIANHTREGRYTSLDLDAFDKAMLNPNTGLTQVALTGKRKQSVTDAEKLLSHRVADFMYEEGYLETAGFVKVIARWHEASDGRGLSQLQRCKYNHLTLNYLLDELMPWHRDTFDFTTIDINRPWDTVRGLSRETLVEITTNIESQEHRRLENGSIGYSEHPRAGTTDDVEALFSICHRNLGDHFTLQDFKHRWFKIVNELNKRMDHQLPFYYWTLNERFTLEQDSFDKRPEFEEDNVLATRHPLRLHRLRLSSREDSSIFTAGRSFLPAKNRPSVRQRFWRFDVGLPQVPEHEVLELPQ